MTSAKNHHPSNLQQTTPAKMTNTNDEPANQNHQQELIRLLAQHFNNQLASRSTTIGNNQPLPLPLVPSGANFQSALAQHYHQQQQHQQNQQQYRLGQDAINFSTQSRALNLEQQTSPTLLGSQRLTIRPQPSPITNMNSIGLTNPVMANEPSPRTLNMVQHPANCNSLMSGMNLFNALNCFGLHKDQFVLSLQQQYLIQAAAAARQLEARINLGDNSHLNMTIEQQNSHDTNGQNQQHRNKCLSNNNMTEIGSETSQSGRELLKFSINTILGRGSPLPVRSTIDDLRSRAGSSPINRFFNDQSILTSNKFNDANHESQTNNEQPISPECDPDVMTDIDSDSSSTPNLQSNTGRATNPSKLSNHPGHHQSASSSTNNQQGMTSGIVGGGEPQHSSHQHPSLSFLAGSTAFPWTVASRGKPRRGMMRRAVFSDSQRVGLEKRFQLQKYISKPDRKKLAEKLGLRDSQVKIWFQNRRMKWRNSKERELLSAGGSREQTLPTRNNPNPDLSDVGETFKRQTTSLNNIGTV